MMATSGVALVAQGADAIPHEIMAAGEAAVEAIPDLAMVDPGAETESARSNGGDGSAPPKPIVAVLIEGESTSNPAGGWNRYPRDVAASMGDTVSVVADGVNGAQIGHVISEGSKTAFLSDADGLNVAVLWIGINDISHGVEPSDVYGGIDTWVVERRSEGWDRIALVTVPKFKNSISQSSSTWGSHDVADAMRSSLNEMIVTNRVGADVIVDLRSLEGIGDDFSVDDQQWRPDRVHFTDAGYALVAQQVTAGLELLAG